MKLLTGGIGVVSLARFGASAANELGDGSVDELDVGAHAAALETCPTDELDAGSVNELVGCFTTARTAADRRNGSSGSSCCTEFC